MPLPVDESTSSPSLQDRPSGAVEDEKKLPRTEEPSVNIPDPQQLSRRVEEFFRRHPAIWHDLHQDKDRMRWLLTIFNFSHFLA
jgi:hypothetical protein